MRLCLRRFVYIGSIGASSPLVAVKAGDGTYRIARHTDENTRVS